MTDSIRIECLLLSFANDPIGTVFSIELPSQSCVAKKLRESIKSKITNALNYVGANDLEVWKLKTTENTPLLLNLPQIRDVFPANYHLINDPDMAIDPSDGIHLIRCPGMCTSFVFYVHGGYHVSWS